MSTDTEARPAASDADRPGRIDAVPVRHPGRWVAIAVIAVLFAMLVHLLVTNKAFDWRFVFQAMSQQLQRPREVVRAHDFQQREPPLVQRLEQHD